MQERKPVFDGTTVTFHGIPFNVSNELDPSDPDLLARLERTAVARLKRPMAVRPRHVPHPEYKFSYGFASKDQAESGAPRMKIVVDPGIESEAILLGDPPVELDEADIRILKEIWTEPAYVGVMDGLPYVDFD